MGDVQLVKHKEYRAVSTLYIIVWHEESVHSTWGKMSHSLWGQSKDVASTTWDTDWDTCGAADHVVITLLPKFMLHPGGIDHNTLLC